MKWSKNEELFLSELKTGHSWQYLPALFFKLHGHNVEVPELSIRKNIKEASKWINTIDLIVDNHEFEIKSRNESFYSADTFPYKTIIVDTCSSYDKKKKKPLGYIMISRPVGAMLFLPSDSYGTWTKDKKYDRTRKIKEEFYFAPTTELCPIAAIFDRIKS